jgi:hypothetical protein
VKKIDLSQEEEVPALLLIPELLQDLSFQERLIGFEQLYLYQQYQ